MTDVAATIVTYIHLLLPLQLIKKRPLSPDVMEIDNKTLHYKFPLGALSSIANRVTGVAMSVGKLLQPAALTSWVIESQMHSHHPRVF